jgi:hypothetical protein
VADGDEYITPTEFPASPAQAALDDTNQRLSEALALGRRMARDFERLTSDQRTRVAAGLAREYRRLSLNIAINANVFEELSAGRDPTTWDDFPAVSGRKDRRMKKRWVHALLVVLTAGFGVAADLLTKSHAVWAPTVVALIANLQTLLKGTDQQTPALPPKGVP